MNNYFLIFILILCCNLSFCQENYITGIIINKNQNPIQYANVGILNKINGTISNTKGQFILKFDKSNLLDTLQVSSVGYKSVKMLCKDFTSKTNVSLVLEEEVIELNEVFIIKNNLKSKSVGRIKTKTNQELFFALEKMTNINLGAEIGRKFALGSKPAILTEFKYFIKQNNFEHVKFRINIYSINNNIPDKRLNIEEIYLDVSSNVTGWQQLDLNDYNIKINQDIIVAVEWIEASKVGNILSLPIFAPSFDSIHYYKQGAQSKWRKYNLISTSMVLTFKQ